MKQMLFRTWFVVFSLSAQALAQVTKADLPQCSLVCWDQSPPSNNSSPSCVFNPGTDFEGMYSPCFYEHCTPKEALTALNITSIICDVPIRDISVGMRIFVVIATLTSGMVIGGRYILKYRALAGEIGWDDWSIVIAVIVVMCAAIGQYIAAHFGMGRDAWKIPFTDQEKILKAFYASTVGYKLGNMFTRMSVLCFYLRLFGTDVRFRIATYVMIYANIGFGISFTIVDLLRCKPISYIWNEWDGEHEGTCMSLSVITWSHSILNIVFDMITLGMAIWMIKGLQMNLKRKLSIIGMFTLGSSIALVTFLRLQALPPLENARNRPWGMAPLAYWSAIEIAAGLILACLPALKKLKYIFRPKEKITYNSNSGGYNSSLSQPSSLRDTKLTLDGLNLPDIFGGTRALYRETNGSTRELVEFTTLKI